MFLRKVHFLNWKHLCNSCLAFEKCLFCFYSLRWISFFKMNFIFHFIFDEVGERWLEVSCSKYSSLHASTKEFLSWLPEVRDFTSKNNFLKGKNLRLLNLFTLMSCVCMQHSSDTYKMVFLALLFSVATICLYV